MRVLSPLALKSCGGSRIVSASSELEQQVNHTSTLDLIPDSPKWSMETHPRIKISWGPPPGIKAAFLLLIEVQTIFVNKMSNVVLYLNTVFKMVSFFKTPGNTPYNGEAPPERVIFFRLQVYERVGILLVEVYKRVGKSVIWVCERTQKGYRLILWLYEVEKTFFVWVWFLFKWQCIYS